MGKILCATRGGTSSYRTQDAVIALAQARGDDLLFLYVVDTAFLGYTERAVRPDVVARELEKLGEFLLAMACERAASHGVKAEAIVRQGQLAEALKEVAVAEGVSLVALGSPSGEYSRFEIDALEKFAADITEATGVETQII